MSLFLIMLVVFSTVTFYLGVTEPLMVFEQLFIFEKEASLVQIVQSLWNGDSWPLALLVGAFSIGFPAVKLSYLGLSSLLPKAMGNTLLAKILGSLSKWSMLDVLVVAVVIVATKTTGLAKATALPGLWYFTACVVLMAVATIFVERRRKALEI